MPLAACLINDAPVRLFSLSGRERIRRVLAALGVPLLDINAPLPACGDVLLLRGDHLYDERLLRALAEGGHAVLCDAAQRPVAARLPVQRVPAGVTDLRAERIPAGLSCHTPDTLVVGHQRLLRKKAAAVLLPVSAAQQAALELRLYGGAYKGVVDLITKFLWPRPALAVVRWCARLGITPNAVTALSILLTVYAGFAFLRGEYAAGLAAGWLMTFLDTVDGKLARVTVQSSRIGNIMDHGLDIIHPPLWYAAWGLGLAHYGAPGSAGALITVIIAGYLGGRLMEATFHLLAPFSLFVWRPFDSYNRLVTARRNPCLILLTGALVLGRPDWGLWLVGAWTVFSTGLLAVRDVQALLARRRGPLRSWLDEVGLSVPRESLAARLFAG